MFQTPAVPLPEGVITPVPAELFEEAQNIVEPAFAVSGPADDPELPDQNPGMVFLLEKTDGSFS